MPKITNPSRNKSTRLEKQFKRDKEYPSVFEVSFINDILGWRNRFFDWCDSEELTPLAGSLLLWAYQYNSFSLKWCQDNLRMGIHSHREQIKWCRDKGFVDLYSAKYKTEMEVFRQSDVCDYYSQEEVIILPKYCLTRKGNSAVLRFLRSFNGEIALPKHPLEDRPIEGSFGSSVLKHGDFDSNKAISNRNTRQRRAEKG